MTDEVRQEDRDLYRELLTIAEHNRIRRACDEPIVDPLLLIARHASPLRTRIAELEGALEDAQIELQVFRKAHALASMSDEDRELF